MKELIGALDDGRILEVFGSGTACVVCPVGSLLYRGKVTRKYTLQFSNANIHLKAFLQLNKYYYIYWKLFIF